VKGLKALNINPGFSTSVVGLKKVESDKLYEFFVNHLNADNQVRWKWEVGSVAMWDNRVTCHRIIPGKYEEPRRGIRPRCLGRHLISILAVKGERNVRQGWKKRAWKAPTGKKSVSS
jgi:alpha-ketoglutarate-dependent taurine dioxygenase